MTDILSGFVIVSTNPDIRLFYELSSPISPQKPVIVTSNSLAAATPLWDEFTTHFASTHTILRYDARFHGRSPLSTSPNFDYEKGHTIEDLAEDVIKVLDKLLIKSPVTFVGLSIGAGVGVVLGAKFPSRFSHLIIVGTKAEKSPGDDEVFDARVDFAKREGTAALGKQSVLRWFGESWIAQNPTKAQFVENIVIKQSIEGFVASIGALRKLDLWKYVEQVRNWGEGDKFVFVVGELDGPPVVRDTKALAKKAGGEIVVVERAGHIVNIQQPDVFHEIVQKQLAREVVASEYPVD